MQRRSLIDGVIAASLQRAAPAWEPGGRDWTRLPERIDPFELR